MSTWLGIDFSGNHLMWRQGCTRSNVWIATVDADARMYRLRDLRAVQELPGDGTPFNRLIALLQTDTFDAAGIDAPFSVPATYVADGHAGLLTTVGGCPCVDRPFPCASDFLAAVAPSLPPPGKHIYRATERYWINQGVNTRSTVWAGARGGAPMTAACLCLLHRVGKDVWPWAPAGRTPCLVEAFPAAQLKTWGLPCQQYNGRDAQARANRQAIIEDLEQRLLLGEFRPRLLDSADALDAVVAAFAAIAVTMNLLAGVPGAEAGREGWIAVHR